MCFHATCSSPLQAEALREKWGDDPDAIFQPDGSVKFIGPKGREESEADHVIRLNHNAQMRFQRSFQGVGLAKPATYSSMRVLSIALRIC